MRTEWLRYLILPVWLFILTPPVSEAANTRKEFQSGTEDPIVAKINGLLRQNWEDNEVQPSEIAEEEEWFRRVSLDIIGRIPSYEEVDAYLDKKSERPSRAEIINRLLADEGYVRHWTNIWTNLSIGRQTPRRVSRRGMEKFYRFAFAENRPWNEIVSDLLLAEGHFEENGEVNYLLAQMVMRDEQVLVTAKTARLFLGQQLQCVQCHNHPFNQWKQEQFWEFNSFFRQIGKIDHRKIDPESGRRVDDYSEIIMRDFSGPVHFDQRDGLKRVAYPIFQGEEVAPDFQTDRRQELVKLLNQGDKPLIARAMVNRVWAHFFGYGLVNPVDDMGPHNPSVMPELLDLLTEEFVKSKYDLKQLISWVCNCEAYHLTSKYGRGNQIDDPAAGEPPLFSKMYLRSLEPEQLYDSLLTATSVGEGAAVSYEQAERRRRNWLRQLVVTFGNDEGVEATTFNGTIPQALMMMNGDLIRNATKLEEGSFLQQLIADASLKPKEKAVRIYLSTLNRRPTSRELKSVQKLIKEQNNAPVAYQDLLWALLNSNEFITNH